MKKAIILFSGGLDSTTCLALAKSQGFECYAMSFNYGQKHQIELESAKRIASHYDVTHKIVSLPLADWGGSALTDNQLEVPEYTGNNEIPMTYVPARNTIFLSFALAWAEVLNANDIFIGVSAIDYSGYPDCRPEFMNAYQTMIKKGMKSGVEGRTIKIITPLLKMTKAQIIKLGMKLKVPYELTWSCYKGSGPCGECDSCLLRQKGFEEAGLKDPIFNVK